MTLRSIRKKKNTWNFCCYYSVSAIVSRPRTLAGIIHAFRTFPFSLFEIVLSIVTPATFLEAFALACTRRRISTSVYLSSVTIHPRHTKPSTCLIHLIVAVIISLETVSYALSRSTNSTAIYISNLFSTSCLIANIPSVVPLPFLNPCCFSPNSCFTLFRILPSNIISNSFTRWLRSLMSLHSVGPWVVIDGYTPSEGRESSHVMESFKWVSLSTFREKPQSRQIRSRYLLCWNKV